MKAGFAGRSTTPHWSCRLLGQTEDALADDRPLDLQRSPVDGLRAAVEEALLELAELVAFTHDIAGEAEQLHLQLAEIAMPLRPLQLAHRRFRPERPALHEAADQSQVG